MRQKKVELNQDKNTPIKHLVLILAVLSVHPGYLTFQELFQKINQLVSELIRREQPVSYIKRTGLQAQLRLAVRKRLIQESQRGYRLLPAGHQYIEQSANYKT